MEDAHGTHSHKEEMRGMNAKMLIPAMKRHSPMGIQLIKMIENMKSMKMEM